MTFLWYFNVIFGLLGPIDKEAKFNTGDSVRVTYNSTPAEGVAEFVGNNITHASVGVLQGTISRQHGQNMFGLPIGVQQVSLPSFASWYHRTIDLLDG